MADIKLYYFNARGLGEISRLILALVGQKYEDVRFSSEEWPKYKPDAPFGQGPYLVYNGKKIGQSAAIACFLAREFGLYGSTNLDAVVIDQVIHIYRDLAQAWQKALYEQDETKKEEIRKTLREEGFPKFFGHFDKILAENSSSVYFIGDSITLADLYLYDVMFQLYKVESFDSFTMYPRLKALYDKVHENPNIKAYVAQRKDTPI